jgi:hypothetical protein
MKETLEEAAEKYQKNTFGIPLPKHSFCEGAKWQKEQDSAKINLLIEELKYEKRNKL